MNARKRNSASVISDRIFPAKRETDNYKNTQHYSRYDTCLDPVNTAVQDITANGPYIKDRSDGFIFSAQVKPQNNVKDIVLDRMKRACGPDALEAERQEREDQRDQDEVNYCGNCNDNA